MSRIPAVLLLQSMAAIRRVGTMTTRLLAIVALLGIGSTCFAQQSDPAASAFDGRWWVDLTCADTQDRSGLVKGYAWAFAVTITDGKLEGIHGTRGAPSSVAFTGTVADDGTLEVRAVGNTGRNDYSVGRVAQGTAYGYTMSGRLEGSRGQAARREVRPCTATFTRT